MPAGPDVRPCKPVKRHDGIFHCLTRDVALVLARLCPPGRILGTQTFRAAWVFRILPTHTFLVVAGVLHFTYTHFSGCRHRRSLPTQTFRAAVTVAVCILATSTQTFRVAGVLHFTYTHFRGDSYANLRKMMSTLEKFSALRAAFFLSRKESETYIEKISALRVRPSSAAIHKRRTYTLKSILLCARKIVSR